MGGAMSSKHLHVLCNNSRLDSHNDWRQPINHLLMYDDWKPNDLLYDYVENKREKQEDQESGCTLKASARISPCRISKCKCKGGTFEGVKYDNYGWTNGICTTVGCNHPITDHIMHLLNASRFQFARLVKLMFDMMNIRGALENVSKKPKSERNIWLEELFESINDILFKKVLRDPFTPPNIDSIYGSPPFEKTNIDQVLLNFCMHIFNDDNILGLKNALILTKFVLRFFDTWMWTTPKEQLNCNSQEYSKSYDYYYRRYLMYCCLPRCFHSISLRYRASKIFGQDVLQYTLKEFRIELQVWCYKRNIMWTEHTKLFCLNYLPIYMDLLEKEVFNNKSPIWDMDYELTDLKRKTIFLEHS